MLALVNYFLFPSYDTKAQLAALKIELSSRFCFLGFLFYNWNLSIIATVVSTQAALSKGSFRGWQMKGSVTVGHPGNSVKEQKCVRYFI